MSNSFSEIKLFQVKPDKLDECCISVKYMKRFYNFDGVVITKVVFAEAVSTEFVEDVNGNKLCYARVLRK